MQPGATCKEARVKLRLKLRMPWPGVLEALNHNSSEAFLDKRRWCKGAQDSYKGLQNTRVEMPRLSVKEESAMIHVFLDVFGTFAGVTRTVQATLSRECVGPTCLE